MRYKGYDIRPATGKRLVPGKAVQLVHGDHTIGNYRDTDSAKTAIDSLLARHGLITGLSARITPTIYSMEIPASKRR